MNESDRRTNDSAWPYASLLFFGFFGSDTPAGRRLAWRSTVALLVFGVAAVALGGSFAQPVPDIVWVLAIPGAVLAIGWSYARYLASLDELSRLIQLKACAFSYGAAMVVAFGLVALGMADTGGAAVAGRFLWLIAFVEILRGLALVRLARTYA